jgi:hypothetical protein
MGILPITDDLGPTLPITHQQLHGRVEFVAALRTGLG